MTDTSASQQIDDIINTYSGWKGELLQQLRESITSTDPDITEEIKWKTASRPEGLPVWSRDGIVCIAEVWKDNIKLIFFKGALIDDVDNLFNARLKSKTARSIEFKEGDTVNKSALQKLVKEAIKLNTAKASNR